MLIPCFDLMDGKVVQLIGGERKALEFDDPGPWLRKFAEFPLVHVVDLDAAMRRGSNRELIAKIVKRLPCQVGGGIRSADDARQTLDLGAKRVVIGSALVDGNRIRSEFADNLATEIGPHRLVFGVDVKHGRLAVSGWKETVNLTAGQVITQLDNFCSAFLYTNVDKEGSMTGFPVAEARAIRALTQKQLMVGGGINSIDQVNQLHAFNVDAIVGMAVYTGKLEIPDSESSPSPESN